MLPADCLSAFTLPLREDGRAVRTMKISGAAESR